jgi:hypothetical protein
MWRHICSYVRLIINYVKIRTSIKNIRKRFKRGKRRAVKSWYITQKFKNWRRKITFRTF